MEVYSSQRIEIFFSTGPSMDPADRKKRSDQTVKEEGGKTRARTLTVWWGE